MKLGLSKAEIEQISITLPNAKGQLKYSRRKLIILNLRRRGIYHPCSNQDQKHLRSQYIQIYCDLEYTATFQQIKFTIPSVQRLL